MVRNVHFLFYLYIYNKIEKQGTFFLIMKIRVTEKYLHSIIKSVIKEAVEGSEDRYDKYGNKIPRGGQGWGIDPTQRNRQGYNQDGTKGPWFSRSVAVATAVILRDTETNNWFILANQRGAGTPDYQGYWNLPCGYLDYNEEAEDAAKREVYEETGIQLNSVNYFGHSTSPNENRQNVIFFFVSFLEGNKSDYGFSTDNMEENEVSGIQWVPLGKVTNIQWAFDHDELINKILQKYKNKVYGDVEYSDYKSIIDKVKEILSNGGDTEYALELLNRIK